MAHAMLSGNASRWDQSSKDAKVDVPVRPQGLEYTASGTLTLINWEEGNTKHCRNCVWRLR